jgi:hypothetical protein
VLDRLDDRYRALLAADPEFSVIGRAFTLDLLLQADDATQVARFIGGALVEVIAPARFDVRWQVALRAPAAVWERFLSDPPPPLHTDIWAMRARIDAFVFEGDTLLAAQHARPLTRATTLLRTWAHGGRPDGRR